METAEPHEPANIREVVEMRESQIDHRGLVKDEQTNNTHLKMNFCQTNRYEAEDAAVPFDLDTGMPVGMDKTPMGQSEILIIDFVSLPA